MVAPGSERKLDRLALQPIVEGLGVVGPGALVEQAGHHVGDAGLVVGVLVGTAANGEFECNQRQRAILHQPGLDAARAHHPLDVHGERGRGRQPERSAGRECDQRTRHAHERFSSGRVSFTR